MKRRLPPSRRHERIPDSVVQLIVDTSRAAKADLSPAARLQAARELILNGYITYRQDGRGVYHVKLARVTDGPNLPIYRLPPPDFPTGHPSHEEVVRFVRRHRLDISERAIRETAANPEGGGQLQLLVAILLLCGDSDRTDATDLEIAYFCGHKADAEPSQAQRGFGEAPPEG